MFLEDGERRWVGAEPPGPFGLQQNPAAAVITMFLLSSSHETASFFPLSDALCRCLLYTPWSGRGFWGGGGCKDPRGSWFLGLELERVQIPAAAPGLQNEPGAEMRSVQGGILIIPG